MHYFGKNKGAKQFSTKMHSRWHPLSKEQGKAICGRQSLRCPLDPLLVFPRVCVGTGACFQSTEHGNGADVISRLCDITSGSILLAASPCQLNEPSSHAGKTHITMNVASRSAIKRPGPGSYNHEEMDLPNNPRELRSIFYPSQASG